MYSLVLDLLADKITEETKKTLGETIDVEKVLVEKS